MRIRSRVWSMQILQTKNSLPQGGKGVRMVTFWELAEDCTVDDDENVLVWITRPRGNSRDPAAGVDRDVGRQA